MTSNSAEYMTEFKEIEGIVNELYPTASPADKEKARQLQLRRIAMNEKIRLLEQIGPIWDWSYETSSSRKKLEGELSFLEKYQKGECELGHYRL